MPGSLTADAFPEVWTRSLTPPPVFAPDALKPLPPTIPRSARSPASSAARIAHVTAMTGANAAAIAGAYASPRLSASKSDRLPPPPSSQIAHKSAYAACCAKGVESDARDASNGADADTGPSPSDCGRNLYRSVSTTLDAARAASQPAAHANPAGTNRAAAPNSAHQKLKTTKNTPSIPSAAAILPRHVNATCSAAWAPAAASENHTAIPPYGHTDNIIPITDRLIRISRGRCTGEYAQFRAPVPAKCAATMAPRTAPKRAACTRRSAGASPAVAPRRRATQLAAPETTCAKNIVRWAMASFASAAAEMVGVGVAHHREGPKPAGKRCGGMFLAMNRPLLPGSAKPP